MKTVVFGGTFNPPHRGHERMVELVKEHINPDRFLIVPTYIPPHKEIETGSPSPTQRLELCKAAFKKYGFAEVSDMELTRKGCSYTFDTLSELKFANSSDELYFIIGSDSLIQFTTWKRFEEIFKLCTLVVIPREKNDFELLSKISNEYKEKYGAEIILLNIEPTVLSSSEIRSGEINENTVSKPVLDYIEKNNLYAK